VGKNVVLTAAFTLVLIVSLSSALKIQPVHASGNIIVISPNGNVDPPGTPLERVGGTSFYRFTADINDATIVVARSNITIDGEGHTLQGSGDGFGFNITISQYAPSQAPKNVTIKNVSIKGFHIGICFDSTTNNVIFKNSLSNNTRAMWLYLSANNLISENTLTNNTDYSIALTECTGNNIYRNNITSSGNGIFLQYDSLYNSIVSNKLIDCGIDVSQSSYTSITRNNITHGWFYIWDSYENIVENNFIDGKPIAYLEEVSDYVVAGDFGQVTLINCNNIRVENLSMSFTGFPLVLQGTNNAIITRNNFTYCDHVILITHCTNVTITGNNIFNGVHCIVVNASHGNTIYGNNVTNGYFGIEIIGYSISSEKPSPPKNRVFGNNFSNNKYGIIIWFTCNLDVFDNYVAANSMGGVWCSGGIPHVENITICHNNFINNSPQTLVYYDPKIKWDNGYPSGGNYWSDYTGTDTNGDGIGDKTYQINSTQPYVQYADRFPLMAPISTFNAGTWNNKTYHVEVISDSTVKNFGFAPENHKLSFDITGENGTTGFCRVAIPKSLMWCNNPSEWTIIIGDTLTAPSNITESGNYTYIYFTYTHSTKTVKITSTYAAPEFSPALMGTILTAVVLLAVVARKNRKGYPHMR